jgi:hypothetical protein
VTEFHLIRLLVFIGLLFVCSFGVLLGVGFSLGMIAGAAIFRVSMVDES